MKQKRYTWVHRLSKLAVLISLCILFAFVDRYATFQPFKGLKKEEIKNVHVVYVKRVIHDMPEAEIEQLVNILVYVTHNGYARDYENPVGGGLDSRFVLEYYDGRIISVGGLEVAFVGCYIGIDQEPYHDLDGTYSRQLSNLFSEYFRIWVENGMK